MPVIERLAVDRFRNLLAVDIHPSPGLNLFVGSNGSGKTSLLEAVHVLSVGRSFRTQKVAPLINEDAPDFVIHAALEGGDRLGLIKNRQGRNDLKFSGEKQRSWSEVAYALPLQVINSDSLALVEGGAKIRRRFMDWSMFHVEHSFYENWRNYRRCLQHRNAILKQGPSSTNKNVLSSLQTWNTELARYGEAIHRARLQFFSDYLPYFQLMADGLFDNKFVIGIEYRAGWDAESKSLLEALSADTVREQRYGMSLFGPHRGDFEIRADGVPVIERLSRGQSKTLVCVMKLAAGALLNAAKPGNGRHNCVYLIDDLSSELDFVNQEKLIDLLDTSGSQCFFTAISDDDLPLLRQKMGVSGKFHVEHGKIKTL